MDKRTGWLKDLKAGDVVAVDRGWGRRDIAEGTVARITPSGRIVVRIHSWEGEFNPDGVERTDKAAWRRSTLVNLTPELRAELLAEAEQRDLVRRLEAVRWRDVPLETLRRVAAALSTEEARDEN